MLLPARFATSVRLVRAHAITSSVAALRDSGRTHARTSLAPAADAVAPVTRTLRHRTGGRHGRTAVTVAAVAATAAVATAAYVWWRRQEQQEPARLYLGPPSWAPVSDAPSNWAATAGTTTLERPEADLDDAIDTIELPARAPVVAMEKPFILRMPNDEELAGPRADSVESPPEAASDEALLYEMAAAVDLVTDEEIASAIEPDLEPPSIELPSTAAEPASPRQLDVVIPTQQAEPVDAIAPTSISQPAAAEPRVEASPPATSAPTTRPAVARQPAPARSSGMVPGAQPHTPPTFRAPSSRPGLPGGFGSPSQLP